MAESEEELKTLLMKVKEESEKKKEEIISIMIKIGRHPKRNRV